MYGKSRSNIICAIFLVLFALLLITSMCCVCDPTVEYIIENQTNEDLTIFFINYKSNEFEVGKVQPGKQIAYAIYIGATELHFIAKNADGKIVFDKILTREQMQEISSLEYKIIIKPQ
jgi:hypothetical protein